MFVYRMGEIRVPTLVLERDRYFKVSSMERNLPIIALEIVNKVKFLGTVYDDTRKFKGAIIFAMH